MIKAKVVCTLGPSSSDRETIRSLILSGMDVARLNFSHGTHESHSRIIDIVRSESEKLDRAVGIMLDTKGPEIRTGKMKDKKPFLLKNGSTVTLRGGEGYSSEGEIYIDNMEIVALLEEGQRIMINDGLLELRAEKIEDGGVVCRVVNGGLLEGRRGVNIPGLDTGIKSVTEKDVEDIEFGISRDVDFIALSFVSSPDDILEVRKIIEARGADIDIIAKIENNSSLNNLVKILKTADGVMVARGDLGVEIFTEEVPLVQKMIIEKANQYGKPVITATQMLESMVKNPRPTRAEASDVANAVWDGTDALMLSGETARGLYPAEAVRTMVRIIEKAETRVREYSMKNIKTSKNTTTDAISRSTCYIAEDLDAHAIITATTSGSTARMVSRYRPMTQIISATPNRSVMRKMSLVWGVKPVPIDTVVSTDGMVAESIEAARKAGLVSEGNLVVITTGMPAGIAGTTNLIKVETVGDIIARGTGIGGGSFTGIIRDMHSAEDGSKINAGSVVVSDCTDDSSCFPLLAEAGAVILPESGLTSDAAIYCMNMGKPVIVGVQAAENLRDGMLVTLDVVRGLIYNGKSTVR